MPRRGDNIRKRKDGRWEARYPLDDCTEGVKKYKSVYGKTYGEAKEKREKMISLGKYKPLRNDIVFKDVLDAWQNANRIRLKEASVSRYQNLIDTHILPKLGGVKMRQFDASLINCFLTSKLEEGRLDGKGGLSASYIRSMILVITSAINYGASEKLCEPLQSPIVKPPLLKKELNIICETKQSMLEQELLDHMNEDKLLVYITLYTGLRIGEACALRWEDISLESRLIFVRHTVSRIWYSENGKKHSKLMAGTPKTEASLRTIPICSKLYDVIHSFPHRKSCGYILMNRNNLSFVSPRTFEYRFKQMLMRCSLDPVNYHALRHTFATRCIERGVDIKSLSEILGHADTSITLNFYVHSSIELKRIQIEKLNL